MAESKIQLTEKQLEELRERVCDYLCEKRIPHVLAVEREAAYLGEVYLPDDVNRLRASALMHDITKRDNTDKQLQLCREFGIILPGYALYSPLVLHSITGASLAKKVFPEFCDDEILSGIRWHTTGREGMSIFEAIVNLSDYIEDTRKYEECVNTRDFIHNGIKNGEEKYPLLYRTMIKMFDNTITHLVKKGDVICPETLAARNYYIIQTQNDH